MYKNSKAFAAVSFLLGSIAIAGCHSKPAAPPPTAPVSSGASAPQAGQSSSVTAANPAELQRIQNSDSMTPQQKSEAMRRFMAQQH